MKMGVEGCDEMSDVKMEWVGPVLGVPKIVAIRSDDHGCDIPRVACKR